MTGNEGRDSLRLIRWIARIASVLAAAAVVLFFIGDGLAEGFRPLLNLTVRESAMMTAFALAWLGLLLGWRWELTGGLITASAMVAFYLLDYLFSGTFPRGPYFLILFSPSLLYLYCGWQCNPTSRER